MRLLFCIYYSLTERNHWFLSVCRNNSLFKPQTNVATNHYAIVRFVHEVSTAKVSNRRLKKRGVLRVNQVLEVCFMSTIEF